MVAQQLLFDGAGRAMRGMARDRLPLNGWFAVDDPALPPTSVRTLEPDAPTVEQASAPADFYTRDSIARDGAARDAFIGQCAAIAAIRRTVEEQAARVTLWLIAGETGTGKTLIAQSIHQRSTRRNQPFIKVLASEWTSDAADVEPSLPLPSISTGTVMLSDVDSLPLTIQAELLRWKSLPGNDRIGLILTTSESVPRSLASGKLLPALGEHVDATILQMPSLRERSGDVLLLVNYFLERLLPPQRVVHLSHDAHRLVQSYDWPGNVAELKEVIALALAETRTPVLSSGSLRRAVKQLQQNRKPAQVDQARSGPSPAEAITDWPRFVDGRLSASSSDLYAEALVEMERHLLRELLNHTGGNQARAARILGITRTSLRKKIHALGIRLPRVSGE